MAFGRMVDVGSASARVVIDLSAAQASVSAFRSIAAQINAQLAAVDKAMARGSQSNAFGVSTQLDQQMQKQAQAAQKLEQQRQRAFQNEQAEQKRTVDQALKALDSWSQAENKRHQQVIDNLQAEANAANALRDKMGFKTAPALGANSLDLTQPNNLGSTQRMTQLVQPLMDLTQPVKAADVTQSFQPIQTTVKQQIQVINALLAQARNQIKQEMNLFSEAAAGTPASVSRTGVEEQAASARGAVDQLDGALKALKVSVAQAAGDPQALQGLDPVLRQLTADAQGLVKNGFNALSTAVVDYANKAEESKSGLAGYFNAVRQNLEQLNETSLAANLQEVSFRLLPLGLGAGAATKQGVDTAQQLQEMKINLQAFTGSEEEANQLMQHLVEQAHRFGQPMFEVLNTMTQFAPGLRAANIQLDDAYNIAVRLASQNPAQGVSGALYALNEALSGQWRSVATLFSGIPMEDLKKAVADKGLIGGFDQILNQLGKTIDLAEKFGQTSRAAFTRLSDSVNNFLAHSMQPFLDSMDSGADKATEFFNRLSQGNNIFATLTGGVLLLTSTLTSALLSLGQFALAFNALKALTFPRNTAGELVGLGGKLLDVGKSIGSSLVDALPGPIVSAFAAAASGISTVVSGALAAGAALAVPALAVAVGTGIGLLIARGLEDAGIVQKGFSAPSAIFETLKQAIFLALSAVVPPLFTFASVVKNAVDAIGVALDLVGTTIAKGANDLAMSFVGAIRGVGKFLGPTLDVLNLANFGSNPDAMRQESSSRFLIVDAQGNRIGVVPAAGVQALGSNVDQNNIYQRAYNDALTYLNSKGVAPGTHLQFVEGYQERLNRDLNTLQNPPDLKSLVSAGLAAAQDFLKSLLGGGEGGKPATTGGGLSGNNGTQNYSDQLEQVYGAAISHMIETTRMLEDRTLSARREFEDFMIQRSRANEDFARSQQQAQDDYNLSRAQSLEDFNRQQAQAQDQVRQQQAKQQADFDKQELRAQQDHLRDMQRLARGVDDAISALDFLTAQKTLQQMKDQQDDFDTADQRRRDDFAAQQQELQDNLDEQQRQRQADFDLQQQRAEAAYRLQQSRQIQNFQIQQQREDQDRQLKLARQAQDYAIADQRRQEDFNLQMLQLDANMNVMTFIWEHGLNAMQSKLTEFFDQIGANASALGIGGGAIVPGLPPPGWTQGPNGTIIPIGGGIGIGAGGNQIVPFASGAWQLPQSMFAYVHQDELIMPAPYAEEYRRRVANGGGDSGSGDTVNVYIDARGSDMTDAKVEQIKRDVKREVREDVRRRRLTTRTGVVY